MMFFRFKNVFTEILHSIVYMCLVSRVDNYISSLIFVKNNLTLHSKYGKKELKNDKEVDE
jgi:hypothetical protein